MNVTTRKVFIGIAVSIVCALSIPGTPTAQTQAKDRIFVVGEVKTPGEYALTQNLTVKQAVDGAKPTDQGKPEYTVILRKIGDSDERREIAIDLKSVTLGSKDDIPLVSGDIVVVPNSKLRVPLRVK